MLPACYCSGATRLVADGRALYIYRNGFGYIKVVPVPKRLIDIDDELLVSAQRELGTTGVSDTVRAALQHAAARTARARQVTWLEEGGLAAMADPARRGDVWR